MENRVIAGRWPIATRVAISIVSVFVALCLAAPASAGSKSKKDRAADAEKSYEKAVVISKKGDRPFLGVNMQELDEDLRKGLDVKTKGGVLITEVVEDSPAEEAGIEDGDIIVEFDGQAVDSPSELRELVGEAEVGEKVKVKVVRDGKPKTITVTMGEYPDDALWSVVSPEHFQWFDEGTGVFLRAFGKGRLGVKATDVNEDLGPYFGVKEGEGVLVLDVVEGSVGEKMGIKAGDVITSVDGKKIGSVAELKEIVGEVEGGEEFDVALVRSKKKVTLQGEMDEDLARAYFPKSPHKFKVGVPRFDSGDLPDWEMDDFRKEIKKEMRDLKKEIEKLKEELEKVSESS